MPIDPRLLEQLIAGIQLVEDDSEPGIGIDPVIADLINAHPELLSPECDAELARYQTEAGVEGEQRHLAVVRQVLDGCRQHGSAAPLRRSEAPSEPAQNPAVAVMRFLSVAGSLEEQFTAGGILRAGMAVAKGVLLLQAQDELWADRDAVREGALAALDEGLPVLWPITPNQELAELQNSLGILWAERLRGDPGVNIERAIACYESALTVYIREDVPHDWAMTQNNLGNAYCQRRRGDRGANGDGAIACYEAALTVYIREDVPHDWAMTQNNLGNAYRERLRGDRGANQDRAIAYFQAALTVRTREDTPHAWARIQNNLGNAYSERLRGNRGANQDRAIECFQAALTVRTREDTPHDWALTQINLGNAYRACLHGDRAANEDCAIACYEAALTVYTPEDTPSYWAGTQNNLGILYCACLGGDRDANLERAIECLEATLTVYTSEDTPFDWAMTHFNLGITYSEYFRGDRDPNVTRAIKCFESAVSILRLSNPPVALSALVTTGGLQRELRRPSEARATWQSALSLRETLLSAGTSATSLGEAARRSRDLAARLALLEVELGDVASAAATLERGRAQTLRAALALDDIWVAKLPDALRRPIVETRDMLAALRGAPPSTGGGTSAGVGLVRAWEEQLASTAAALEAALEAAQSASGFTPPPALDVAALAALAPVGGAVVLLAATADTGLAIVLPQGGAGRIGPEHSVMLPEANESALRHLLGEWMEAYETFKRESREATKRGAALWPALLAANAVLERVLDGLWDSVMGPVLARLPDLGLGAGAPLMLLPQGDLALLPLHAAGRVSDGVRRAVLDDHVVSYAPSGAVLRTASERLAVLPGQPRDLSGLFNPDLGPGRRDGALPATEQIELPGLRELFGAADARTWTGRDATVERALDLCAAGASYVHFSCHGLFVWDEPEKSGLALAGGRTLTVQKIVGDLRLPRNRWVALSACETAMVDVHQQPDEFVGLPAAFLQAGAPGVMATLWSVLDEPTAQLMPEFYRCHLDATATATDQPPAACLRDAVRWLRNQPGPGPGPTRISDDDILFATPAEPDPTPVPHAPPPNLLQLPIVWAAYSFHGV